jgi:excisionase family DNA binding protein
LANLVSKQQLAKYLQVSTMTIDRYRNQGMPWTRVGVKLVRFDLVAVKEWLEQNKEMDFALANRSAENN